MEYDHQIVSSFSEATSNKMTLPISSLTRERKYGGTITFVATFSRSYMNKQRISIKALPSQLHILIL